jgi:autotransporter-associated beta strand protein
MNVSSSKMAPLITSAAPLQPRNQTVIATNRSTHQLPRRLSQSKRLVLAWAALTMFLCRPEVRAATLFAPAIPDNVSPVYVTADALLTVTGYANSNATTTANLGQAGTWFGVVNGNVSALDGTECVTLQFAPSAALYGIGHVWTRSKVIISGFTADPGFTDAGSYATGVSYSNGTLTYSYNWDAGTEHDFTFSNPAASMGRILRLNVYDTTTGWQAGITRIDYTPSPAAAVANLGSPQQTMDNFSASDAWSMQNVGLWSLTNKTIVADLLFKTNSGIGLSAWRFNLAAGFDPTVQAGTLWQPWRTENGFLLSSNNYDWTRQAGQRWFLSAAKVRGIDQYLAMVYSPPTNFTRNGFVYGTDGLGSSNLKPGYAAAFAQYIADVLAHFQTNSVTAEQVAFNYVMPVNEPFWEWNDASQEGCRHANADIIADAQALNAALTARGLGTQIVLSEAGTLTSLYQTQTSMGTKYGGTYGKYMTAFNSITNLLSHCLSAHSYGTDDPNNQLVSVRQTLKSQLAANPFWRYWQSEYCILGTAGPGRDLTMTTALNVSRVIWADLAVANASAWHWWLSLSQADYKDGLLYTDYWQPGDTETLYCSKNFWAFGQWSRFIRPGWKRVDMTSYANVFGLMSAAFAAPASNAVAMVFINASATNQTIAPDANGLGAGRAVAYWTPWITSATPSDNLSPLPPVSPGGSCTLPTNAVMTFVASILNSNTAPAPVIVPIANQNAAVGQTLQVTASISGSNAPAPLLSISAYSDNPALLPGSNIVVAIPLNMGAITREFFTNFSGAGLSNLTAAPFFPNAPSSVTLPGLFEAPQNIGGNYGTRMRGFVVAPQTGNYTFWIASRDASQLFLSSDENPVNKTLITAVTNYTASREWTKEPNQQSAPIGLLAGRRYYIEAVQAAGTGADHLAVGWQLPDSTLEQPIPGSRLSAWTDPYTNTIQRIVTMQMVRNQTGSANVSVIATDTIGRRTTNIFSVTVVTNYVHPTSVVSGYATLCSGTDSAMLQAALTGTAPWTLTWSDGFVQSTNGSPATRLVSPSSTTSYTLTGMFDANGPSLAGDRTGSATVVRPQAPLKWTGLDTNWNSSIAGVWQDAALAGVTYCPGLSVIFDDTAAGNSPLTVALNASVSPSSLAVSNAAQTYLITGSGSIAGATTSLTKGGSGTLILAASCTYGGGIAISAGTLQIGNGGSVGNIPNLVNVLNNGTLAFNRSANLTWVPPQAGVTGTGTIVQNGPGKIVLGNDTVFGASGTEPNQSVVIGPGATLETVKFVPVGNVTLNGGKLSGAGGNNPTYQSWVLTRGVAVLPNAVPAVISNTSANSGVHILSTNVFDVADGPADDDLIVSARLINPPAEYGAAGGGITKLGAGRMVLNGANTYTGDTSVSNGVLVINGSVTSRVIVGNGGTLGGAGTINGNVTVLAGAVLSPGTNLGRLTINGSLTLAGTTVMELNKSLSPTNDSVTVSGPLTLGGSLTVTNLGPELGPGDSFRLFSIVGTNSFSHTDLPALKAGYAWTNKLSIDGTLAVVQALNPNPTNILAQMDGGNLVITWPADQIGWQLQVQTNELAIGLSTNWTSLSESLKTNVWVVPIDPNSPPVFYRLSLP